MNFTKTRQALKESIVDLLPKDAHRIMGFEYLWRFHKITKGITLKTTGCIQKELYK